MLTATDHTHQSAQLDRHADQLLATAQAFQSAAGKPGSSAAAPAALDYLDEAFGILSAAWCEVAADAAPGIIERWGRNGGGQTATVAEQALSREQEAHLMACLHDVAGALASSARTCREARSTIVPLLEVGQRSTTGA